MKTDPRSLVTAERRATAEALLIALGPFVEANPNMSVQIASSFLRVVADEGKSITEYADDAGQFKTVMTRHFLDLGQTDRYGDPGLDWIEHTTDPEDGRRKSIRLATKGAAVIDYARRALSLLLRR